MKLKFRVWNGEKMFEGRDVVGPFAEISVLGSCMRFNLDDFFEQLSGRFSFMLFTGVFDVEGTEIYEGDILDTWLCDCRNFRERGEVVFFEGKFVVKTGFPNFLGDRKYKIIGNIYEHPNFLSPKK